MAKILQDEPCPCGSPSLFRDCHGPKVRIATPPEIKQRVPLKVIAEPDPNTRAVFERIGEGTIIMQGYETNIGLVCGTCAALLTAGVRRENITGIVLRCKQCGAFNENVVGT